MQKIKILIYSLVIVSCLLMLTNSCTNDDKAIPDQITISDENFYMELGITMINCYTDIYNQNLAGKPSGTHNITANGPMGGKVTITGNTTYDNTHGIATDDLLFSMTAVKNTYSIKSSDNKTWITEVTLTGTTTYTGSFSDSYTSLNHQSDNLNIKGSVTYDGVIRSIDMSGQVIINHSAMTSVNIFGHTVTF